MGSQMPDCYPKLWYSIFQDKWFVKQSALRRGIFLQLIIWAKGNGDTGAVIFHGWGAVGSAFNCDGRKSARKILGNFHAAGRIVLFEEDGVIEIKICNYKYYQRDKKSARGEKSRKNPGKVPLKERKGKVKESKGKGRRERAQFVIQLFGEICPMLPQPKELTETRISQINQRDDQIKGNQDEWRSVFKLVAASDFLTGKNDRDWTAKFDWIINKTNFIKIRERNYDNTASRKPGAPGGFGKTGKRPI